ncbi:MAG: hypothetical protein IJC04_06835 [Oscillospiraceae bacterium]|nr:hypothetical protein [Oscillospiraceae bacterium]
MTVFNLKEKVKEFLKLSKLNKTVLCKGAEISATSLNSWLRGDRELSTHTEDRIAQFIVDYTMKLVNLCK